MVRVCQSVLASRADAEDCAAAALLQVLEQPRDDVRNVEALLITVAKRRALDHQRNERRARMRDARSASLAAREVVDVAEEIVSRAEAVWLDEQARALLSPRVYQLIALIAQGIPVSEVAEQLGMSQRAAESHLLRGRRTLRAALARTFGVLGVLWGCAKRWTPSAAPAAAVVLASALTLGVPNAHVEPIPSVGKPPIATTALYNDELSGAERSSSQAHAPTMSTPTALKRKSASADRPAPRRSQVSGERVLEVVGPAETGVRIEDRDNGEQQDTVAGMVLACVEDFRVTAQHVGC